MSRSNIGHDANALWKHYDDSVDEKFLINRQQMHVSILSIGSFVGRLLSGTVPSLNLHQSKDRKEVHCSSIMCRNFSANHNPRSNS